MKIGDKFGRWRITELLPRGRVSVRCDCGMERVVQRGSLKNGKSKSCGCLKREMVRRLGENSRRHGHSTRVNERSRTYRSWDAMKARCLNTKNIEYHRYGGRGITVCDRWQSFENFLADMGERPEGKSLDRVNSSGNYEPNNCRWATAKEQRANQRPRGDTFQERGEL